MFPNGNVGLENSKFYEDVPARGHNACAGRHELQVPQITKRLHKDSARQGQNGKCARGTPKRARSTLMEIAGSGARRMDSAFVPGARSIPYVRYESTQAKTIEYTLLWNAALSCHFNAPMR